jgi:hypothetical protein
MTPDFTAVHVAAYSLIALPPLLAGAVNDTRSEPRVVPAFPDTATTPVGAPGKTGTVCGAEACEAGPVPIALVAVTVHV